MWAASEERRGNVMGNYGWVILGALVGFFVLAYLLLAPVNRFLKREEEVSKEWTREALAQRHREQTADGQQENGREHPARPISEDE